MIAILLLLVLDFQLSRTADVPILNDYFQRAFVVFARLFKLDEPNTFLITLTQKILCLKTSFL
jgi:hypothetical protein